jgi:hypothetical protein
MAVVLTLVSLPSHPVDVCSNNSLRVFSTDVYSGFLCCRWYPKFVTANLKESRSRWPRDLSRVSAATRLLGLRVRILPGAWMSLFCECCVLSDRGLCVGLVTLPEESYRVWWVWVWSWILDNEETLAHWGCCAMIKKFLRKSALRKVLIQAGENSIPNAWNKQTDFIKIKSIPAQTQLDPIHFICNYIFRPTNNTTGWRSQKKIFRWRCHGKNTNYWADFSIKLGETLVGYTEGIRHSSTSLYWVQGLFC